MSDEEILSKAIEKAVKNKWLYQEDHKGKVEVDFSRSYDAPYCYVYFGLKSKPLNDVHGFESPFDIIFSHDFAKAFWGDERRDCGDDCKQYDTFHLQGVEHDHYGWQYHLQQMVLEEHPLQYLARFI